MNKIIYLILLSFIMLSCSDKKNESKYFWEIYEWFYKEKSLDKTLLNDSHTVEDKEKKMSNYLIQNFKNELNIDSNWKFDYQEYEVKSTFYGKSIIEISTYFTIESKTLLVLEIYYNSENLLYPRLLEQNIFYTDNGGVDSKTLWNKKINLD